MSESTPNPAELAEEALEPKKFNIVDTIRGRSYPKDVVRVFMDEAAAAELKELNARMGAISNLKDEERRASLQEEYDRFEKEAQEVRERIIESRLEVHLTGIPRKVYKPLLDKFTEDGKEDAEGFNYAVFAESVEKVVNGQGEVDDHKWTPEEAEEFALLLPSGEWDRIYESISGLTFATGYFDEAVDAGFLQRR